MRRSFLAPGVYTANITVTAGGANGSPHTIAVMLTVYEGSAVQRVYLPVTIKP